MRMSPLSTLKRTGWKLIILARFQIWSQFLFALITLSLMMIRVIEIKTIKVEKA